MSQLVALWNLILESNTFNFAILVVIFVMLFQKLKVGEMISKIQADIISAIEESKSVKINAEQKLQNAKMKVKNLDVEISEKLSTVTNRAQNLEKSIEDNVRTRISQIENNAQRVIASELKNIKVELSSGVAKDAVDLAQKFIAEKLRQEPDLHDKYIEESIQELDRISL